MIGAAAEAERADLLTRDPPAKGVPVFGLSTALGLVVIAAAGLLVGAVAKLLVPGRDPGGIVTTCGLGIAGSFLGGWIGRELNLAVGFAISVAGAMLILIGYRVLRRVDRSR